MLPKHEETLKQYHFLKKHTDMSNAVTSFCRADAVSCDALSQSDSFLLCTFWRCQCEKSSVENSEHQAVLSGDCHIIFACRMRLHQWRTYFFFFLIWKIPRLHSNTNFLPEWFLVRGPYKYFLSPHCKVVCFFSLPILNAAFFSSHILTEKDYILKSIPASFIMKVRAGMVPEWTPRIFSCLS